MIDLLGLLLVLLFIGTGAGLLLWFSVRKHAIAEASEVAREPVACSTCKYFELEAAQTKMRSNPAFMRMANFLSPYEATRRSVQVDKGPCPDCKNPESKEPCGTCSGDGRLVEYQNVYSDKIPVGAKWSEYGWCTNPAMHKTFERPYTEFSIYGGSSYCDGELYVIRPKTPPLKLVG